MIEANFYNHTYSLIASPPAQSPLSLSCVLACLLTVNLLAYTYFPLSHVGHDINCVTYVPSCHVYALR